MDISIVVPTFNRREIVTRTIEALAAQNFPAARYEIIVVVDGSTDGTADALGKLRPACQFRVIEQENRGLAGARNTGYRAAQSDLVLFLDDDMLCDSGLVSAHFSAHKGVERCVAFGAVFLTADSPPSLAAECFHQEIGAFHLERKRNPELEWQITDCIFANTSLPRAMLAEAGGFDEKFRMREDLELGIRLFNAGAHSRYIGSAVAHQYFKKGAADLIRDAEAFAAADVLLARKHPDAIIKGQLNWMARERSLKQRLFRFIARVPSISDFLLAPICGMGEICFQVPAFRKMGVRALQLRRRIHWFHKVLELGWQPLEHKIEEYKIR